MGLEEIIYTIYYSIEPALLIGAGAMLTASYFYSKIHAEDNNNSGEYSPNIGNEKYNSR